ncbi:ATP-dependent translocase ABCB1-like isoform X3 [Porites lutea]|uniref:ATP-dependent translocase ABCB1-like isoform X3 n=1 Tax=Porites lutea TaxID=51062 RepID=UPI003CC6D9BB
MDEPAVAEPLLAAEDGKTNPSDFEVKICPDECETNGEISANDTDDAKDGADDSNDKKKEEAEEKPPIVSFGQLFRFSDKLDVVLITLGTLAAIAHGAAIPVQFLIFGDLIQSFIEFEQASTGNATQTYDLNGEMTKFALYYVYLAAGNLVVAYGQMAFWSLTATRQVKKMRLALFSSILKQDIGWFDTSEPGELNNRFTEDLNQVFDGIGHKIGMFVHAISIVLAGFVLAFVYGWKLTLVLISVTPLLVVAGGILGKVMAAFTTKGLDAYAKAGSVAVEVLSSIRTVAAFGGENEEIKRYSSCLGEARDFGVKMGVLMGLGIGFLQIIIYGSYALAFWYGAKLIINQEMNGGDVLIVFFSVVIGAMQLGQAGPNFQAIVTARGAAYKVFLIIDRVPPFDSSSTEGTVIEHESFKGDITFNNIEFSYPSRPDVKVSVDGHNIPSLNLKWLRQHIGVVSQEPVLFDTTIAENIRYGKEDVTQEEIEKATKMANAHDFIRSLPKGYDTLVGEGGTQLSGGQKQRIAIARALVKDPRILLLDEATSALDSESESIVQAALDRARQGRTTIVIAHRLSTVQNADLIAVIQEGMIVEKGSHDELMNIDGLYRQLVTLQIFKQEEEGEDEDNDDEINEQTNCSEGKGVRTSVSSAPANYFRSVSRMSSDSEREGPVPGKLRAGSMLDKAEDKKDKGGEEKILEEEVEPAPFIRILKLNTPEWPYIFFGSFAAIINGLLPLAFALLLSELLTVFTSRDAQKIKKESEFWSLMYVAVGITSFFTHFIQTVMFAKSGELLTLRLRKMAFQAILRQDMSYFDDPLHSTGALTTALSTHASDVKGATGSRVSSIVASLSTIIASTVFALFYGWKLALVVLSCVPFLAVANAVKTKVMVQGSMSGKGEDKNIQSGKIAVETIANIRTVVSLVKEKTFFDKYAQALSAPYKKALRNAQLEGISFGISEAFMFLANAVAFKYGGYLVAEKEMTFNEMMKVVLAILVGGLVLGQISAFAPDYVKAKVAAARLFKIFDRKSLIDSSSEDGLKPSSITGTVQLRGVRFRYPTRQDVKVLRGLSLSVQKGQKLALVGSSGCGKSTVISLLERFYDVLEGEVAIDGNDVRSLNIQWLRSHIGIVSQEPVLFGCSIADNIAYGDNSREVGRDEIIRAAEAANIHSFINSLPKGYDTLVGDKGTLISGGQKQRIAIARALVRNPQILLLDEATSALDTESEKVVQQALDAASEGRTAIIIAHRLSTVQNADVIAVIHHGRVMEQGTHQELLGRKGIYHGLVTSQMQNVNN